MTRLFRVARVQLVAWPSTLGIPWAVLALSFVVNLAIFAGIGDRIPGGPVTGGLASIYVAVAIVASQSPIQMFPFALGMGVTRRVYYGVACLLALAQAAVFGALIYLLKLVEDATDGWGMSLRFFGPPFLRLPDMPLQIIGYAVPFVLASFIGLALGVVVKRWGVNGFFAATLAVMAVVGLLSALLTWQRQWTAVWHWLVDQPTLSLVAGWPALLALLLAVVGFLVLRKATP